MDVNVKVSIAADGTLTCNIDYAGREASVVFNEEGVEFSVPEEKD